MITRTGCACPRSDVRECEAGHGLVTQTNNCETCSDYEPDGPAYFGPVLDRHLVYHLLPVSGNDVWRRSVDQLRLRWGLFNGRKVIAIATGASGSLRLDSSAEVQEYLPPDCEVVEVPNDPSLREVVSWRSLWGRVLEGANDEDAVFYAHAKAVTRPIDPGNSCQWWASLAYSLHLDHWPVVAEQLTQYPITGAFKKIGDGFRTSSSSWHYSGTFFWVRVGDFRARPWQTVEPIWYGTEAWPGLAYRSDEAGCLFLEDTVAQLDLYSPSYWTRVVRPMYTDWLRQNPPAFFWTRATSARRCD